ncbi:MAG: helix-turn-helix domain-containing protein [Morganella sp. (in: enterobacteria)]
MIRVPGLHALQRVTHSRQEIAVIYGVGVSTIYRYFPAAS